MAGRRDSLPVRLCEFLKFMRAPRSRSDIARELGWNQNTAAAWTDEMAANGILVEVKARSRRDSTPAFYQLAPEWGGPSTGATTCSV